MERKVQVMPGTKKITITGVKDLEVESVEINFDEKTITTIFEKKENKDFPAYGNKFYYLKVENGVPVITSTVFVGTSIDLFLRGNSMCFKSREELLHCYNDNLIL